MKTLLIIAALFCIYKIISGLSAKRKEEERQEAEYRREHDAAILRQEWREMQEKARLDILKREAEFKEQERQRKQAEREREELRKEQERQAREQERQAKEQTRLAKEQERQAAILEKHEEMLRKCEFQLRQAKRDIDFLKDRLAQQESMKDYLLLQQNGTVPGSKEHDAIQKKIIVLDNQIHQTKSKFNKAVFAMKEAKYKLA